MENATKSIQGFCVAALRSLPGDAPLTRPAFIEDSESWGQFFDLCERRGILEVALSGIQQAPWALEMPDSVHRVITRHEQGYRNQRFQTERILIDVLKTLGSAGVDCVVLDGQDLSRRFYPSQDLRSMSRIDLWVPGERWIDALWVLGHSGFRSSVAFGLEETPTVVLEKEGWGRHLRIHRRPDSINGPLMIKKWPPHELDRLWERAEGPLPGLPSNARALRAEDLLVLLAARDAQFSLRWNPVWLNDLHSLISTVRAESELRWDEVMNTSETLKVLPKVVATLKFLANERNTPVPHEVIDAFSEKIGFLNPLPVVRPQVIATGAQGLGAVATS